MVYTKKYVSYSIIQLLIFGLLFSIYREKISSVFSYLNFDYNLNVNNLIVVGGLLISYLLIQLTSKSEFGYLLSALFGVFGLFPNLILFASDNDFFAPVLLMFILTVGVTRIKDFSYKNSNVNLTGLSNAILLVSSVFVAYVVLRYGVNFDLNFFLFGNDTYEARETVSELASQDYFYLYLYSGVAKIFIPMGIVISIKNRNTKLALTFFVLSLILFLANPHKSIFFVNLIVFSLAFFPKKIVKVFLLSILIISAYVAFYDPGDVVLNIIIRRTMFIPALLNKAYFSIFENDMLFLSYSKFNPFIEYQYNLSPPKYVGLEFYHNASINANNGIISTGFMNFSYIGALTNIFIVFLFFKRLSRSFFGFQFMWPLFIPLILTLISSSLIDCFISHGFMYVLIAAYLGANIFIRKRKNSTPYVEKMVVKSSG